MRQAFHEAALSQGANKEPREPAVSSEPAISLGFTWDLLSSQGAR